MKTYLVTGVAGFIGSAVARKLIGNGHNVVGVDNFLTGIKENVPKEIDFFELDITEKTSLDVLNKYKIDAVLHLAAQTSGEISFDDPAKDLSINALGTYNMLQYCRDNYIDRFIYASSATVYGDPEINPIPVSSVTKPKSYYGITKLTGEHYARLFSDKMNVTTLRMFNVYGPGQNIDNIKQGMVSIYLYYMMKREPVLVKGRGDRFRDFIYIDDVVNAWVSVINEEKSFGKTYNLSSGEKTEVSELLKELAAAWGDSLYPVTYTEGTPGDAIGSQGDISEIKADLNWSPAISLKEGLELTVKSIKHGK